MLVSRCGHGATAGLVGYRRFRRATPTTTSRRSTRDGVDALREAKAKFLEQDAVQLLTKVSFLTELTQAEKDEYIATTIEDLRTRLRGWPPEPARSNRSGRLDAISASMENPSIILRRSYPIGNHGESLLVLVEENVEADESGGGKTSDAAGPRAKSYRIRFYADSEIPMQLHWGVIGNLDKTQSQWMLPPDELRPFDTDCNEEACNTDLGGGGPLQMTMVEISRSNPVAGITFVLKMKGVDDGDRWIKATDGGNFLVPLPTDWVQAAMDEKKAAARAGYLLEKLAQGTEGVIMYHHTYTIPEGTMIALVKAVKASYQVEIVVDTKSDAPINLIWGMATGKVLGSESAGHSSTLDHADLMVNASGEWVLPPDDMRPDATECEEASCNTELVEEASTSNVKRAIINAKPIAGVTGVSFVLKVGNDLVRNHDGEDFHIPVPAGILQELSHEATKSAEVVLQRVFALGRDGSHGRVLALVSSMEKDETMVEFFSDSPEPLVLHWGVSRTTVGEWTLPDIAIMYEPSDSEIIAGKACETQFKMAPGQLLKDLLTAEEVEEDDQSGSEPNGDTAFAYLQRACLHFKANSEVIALPFVVRTKAADSKQIWFKDYWGNYLLPFTETTPSGSTSGALEAETKESASPSLSQEEAASKEVAEKSEL